MLRIVPRALVLVVVSTVNVAFAEDWPQWLGPARDGLSRETGLLKAWPEGEPRRRWLFENCGVGYAGPAIVEGRMYNGRPASAVKSTGAEAGSILVAGEGIVGRGVLLDVPRLRGVPWLEGDACIAPEELVAAEQGAGLRVGEGDILLVSTGRDARRAARGPWNPNEDGLAGLHPECVPWLRERDVAVLGSDGVSDPLPGNAAAGWLNVWYGWRMTFVIIGLPGIVLAALIWLTVEEPPRGYSDGPSARPRAPAPPFFEVFRFLITRNSFMHMSVAAALHSVVWYSGTIWNNSFFVWYHGLNTGQAGNFLAIFALIGTIGSFAGGFLSDKISTRKNDRRWYMWVPGIACIVMVPIQFFAYLSPDLGIVVPIAFSFMYVFASFFFGPSFAVAQSVATVRMRAVSASVLLFIQTIIGMTLGPAIVGWFSDRLEPTLGQGPGVAYPMAVIGVVNLWAALHYFLAARKYREDLAETARLNQAAAAA